MWTRESIATFYLRIVSGDLRLVIITGNAGDGKTAFIQMVETRLQRDEGAAVDRRSAGNGIVARVGGHRFETDSGMDRRMRAIVRTMTYCASSLHPTRAMSLRPIRVKPGSLRSTRAGSSTFYRRNAVASHGSTVVLTHLFGAVVP